MSLSLEVKKFINSENIGGFVTVTLPGMLPADSEELRAMNRARAAAEKAGRDAKLAEDEKNRIRQECDEAARAVESAKKELAENEKTLAGVKSEHEKAAAASREKKAALDEAEKALNQKNAELDRLNAELSAAEEAYRRAESIKDEAHRRFAEMIKGLKGSSDGEKTGAETDAEAEEKPASEANGEADGEKPAEAAEGSETAVNAEADEKKAPVNAETGEAQAAEEEKSEETAKNGSQGEAKPTAADAAAAFASAKIAAEKAEAELKAKREGKTGAENALAEQRKQRDKLAAELDELNRQLQARSDALSNETTAKNGLAEHVRALEKAHSESKTRLNEAQKAHTAAVNEEKRLRDAIRVPKTECETAAMHYIEGGKGETLLLIHTAGQSLYTFRNVFYKLTMNYHVIAVDLIGHGYSARSDYFDYSASSHAESLAGFMDALGIEWAHLVGFSMGAGYALELARKYPQRVGSVIAMSPGGVTSAMPLAVRLLQSPLFGGIASKLYRVKSVEKLLDECLFDHTVIGMHDVLEYYKCAADPAGRRAIRFTVSGFDEGALFASLSDVRANVLVISSDTDRWHPVELGETYANALGGADFAVVRNAGHLFHEEKPDRFVELVREFIPAGYGDDAY